MPGSSGSLCSKVLFSSFGNCPIYQISGTFFEADAVLVRLVRILVPKTEFREDGHFFMDAGNGNGKEFDGFPHFLALLHGFFFWNF